jgi:hypothetical protein
MIWGALTAKARGWLAGAGAILGGVLFFYLKGRRDQLEQEYQNDLSDYVETRRRMDETTIPNDASDVREWLRKRGKQ